MAENTIMRSAAGRLSLWLLTLLLLGLSPLDARADYDSDEKADVLVQ